MTTVRTVRSALAIPFLDRAGAAITAAFHAFGAVGGVLKALVTGEGAVTFDRADTASVTDFEGRVKTAIDHEIRFEYGRRVENLFTDITTTLASGSATTAVNVGVGTFVFSMGAGTGTATFSGTATGSTGTLNADGSSRTAETLTITAAGTIIVTASVADLSTIQLEDATGQANQNPSKYVSVGVATGSEKIAEVTAWTAVGDWVENSVDSISGSASTGNCDKDLGLITGKKYVVSFTVSNRSGGGFTVMCGGTISAAINADGDHTVALIHDGANTRLRFNGGSAFTGDITNISIKEADHGAFVDGVRYYDHENGNTVTSNVVDESVTGDTLVGGDNAVGDWRALFEPPATNLCDDSIPDSSKPKWSLRVGGTETLNNAVAPNGVNEMTLVECNGSESDGIRLTYTGAASTDHVVSAYVGFVDNGIVNKFGAHDSVSSWEAYIEVTWTAGVPAITTAVTGPATNKSGYIEQINATTWRYVVGFTSSASISTSYVQFQVDRNEGSGVGVNLWGYDVIQGTRIVSSHIPTSGGPASRLADVGDGMFDYANWSQTEGTWFVDVWFSDLDTGANQNIFSIQDNAEGVLYEVSDDITSHDGTGTSVVALSPISTDNRFRVVADFGTSDTLECGMRDVGGAGSFAWDGTPVNYDGDFATDSVFNIAYGASVPIRLRDLKGYTTRQGKTWIEENL